MKYAQNSVMAVLPVLVLLALVATGCNDETEPEFTRLIINPQCGVVPLEIEGYATLTGGNETGDPTGGNNNLEITWDFGDGATGTTSIAYHVYREAGDYDVVVSAKDADGKTASISVPVTVRADTLSVEATSNFHGDLVNPGEEGLVTTGQDIHFTVFAESCTIDRDNDDHYRNLSFVWRMNDSTGQIFESRDPVFSFDAPGTYEVSVAVSLPELAVTRHSSLTFIVTDP